MFSCSVRGSVKVYAAGPLPVARSCPTPPCCWLCSRRPPQQLCSLVYWPSSALLPPFSSLVVSWNIHSILIFINFKVSYTCPWSGWCKNRQSRNRLVDQYLADINGLGRECIIQVGLDRPECFWVTQAPTKEAVVCRS